MVRSATLVKGMVSFPESEEICDKEWDKQSDNDGKHNGRTQLQLQPGPVLPKGRN